MKVRGRRSRTRSARGARQGDPAILIDGGKGTLVPFLIIRSAVLTAGWIGQHSVASKEESAVEDVTSERLYVDGSTARSVAACILKEL